MFIIVMAILILFVYSLIESGKKTIKDEEEKKKYTESLEYYRNKNRTYEQLKNVYSDNNATESFNVEAYNRKNASMIQDFERKYDLTTVESISSIPVPSHKQTTEPYSVVSVPEQILQKKATQYSKENKMDLAIACLKKSNEFMKKSFYAYQIKDYNRLVDFLYKAGRFEEAKTEQQKIYSYFGKDEIQVLKELMQNLPTQSERNEYYKNIIVPAIEEKADRQDYYWILEHLPESAPKSFGGYRRMKKANTENYLKLVQKVNNKKAIYKKQ